MHFQVLVEDFVAPASLLLGAVHGKICITEEHLGGLVFRTGHSRTDAGVGLDGVPKNIERPLQLARNTAGHYLQVGY